MATAKFSSIRAEKVLSLRVLDFGKNGLDFCVRKEAKGGNVSVIYIDLLVEVEEMIERRGQTVCTDGYQANTCDVQGVNGLAATARTVDGSCIDRIGQRGNEVSAKLLLNVRHRLQLREAWELDVSTKDVRTDQDSANRAG